MEKGFSEKFFGEGCIEIDRELANKHGLKEAFVHSYIMDKYVKNGIVTELYDLELIIKKKALKCTIDYLVKNGLLEIYYYTSEEKRQIISEDNTNRGNGNKTCEWCNYNSYVLHKHHYPIPKAKGGTEMVSICPNCHYQYHHLNCYYLPSTKRTT